jgi:hypothetical protein
LKFFAEKQVVHLEMKRVTFFFFYSPGYAQMNKQEAGRLSKSLLSTLLWGGGGASSWKIN